MTVAFLHLSRLVPPARLGRLRSAYEKFGVLVGRAGPYTTSRRNGMSCKQRPPRTFVRSVTVVLEKLSCTPTYNRTVDSCTLRGSGPSSACPACDPTTLMHACAAQSLAERPTARRWLVEAAPVAR